MLKTIIFDMDGVIVDSEPLHFEVFNKLLGKFGKKVSVEEHSKYIGVTDYDCWSELKYKLNIPVSVEKLIEMYKENFIENINDIQMVDNVESFIKNVYKDYSLGLASSNNRRSVDAIITKFQLEKYFKIFINGEEVKNGKPAPEIFLKAANEMNASYTDCIVIEDSNAGVEAAKAANMKCIGYKNPNSGNQDLSKADLIIKNFNELSIEILESLFYV